MVVQILLVGCLDIENIKKYRTIGHFALLFFFIFGHKNVVDDKIVGLKIIFLDI